VERGKIKRPPVLYISPVDPILDAVKSKTGTKHFKVTLPAGTIVYHAVFDNGSNESFMIQVQEVSNFCKRKDFFKAYEKAQASFADCTLRCHNAQVKLDDAIADPTTTPERMQALTKSLELGTTAVVFQRSIFQREGSNSFPSTRHS